MYTRPQSNNNQPIFSKKGKKHILKNIGKKTIVINYTNLTNGLIVKNKQLRPNDTVTIFYCQGTFHTASISQIQTIELSDFPENVISSLPSIIQDIQSESQETQSELELPVDTSNIYDNQIIDEPLQKTPKKLVESKVLHSFSIQEGLNQIRWYSSQENIVLNNKFIHTSLYI